MTSRNFKTLQIALAGGALAALTGCMAIPAAGLALSGTSLYNAANPEKNVTVTLDQEGSARLQKQLVKVNHMAVLAKNSMGVAFSDVWEKSGKRASIIADAGDPSNMSMSQASTAMASACKSGIDATVYGRMNNLDVDRMSMLIGKADAKVTGDVYVYNCKTKAMDHSPVLITFNAMGQDQGQTDRSIGAGTAAKLLELGS